MATHSSTLAWKIPWTEEPGRLQSKGSQRVGHNWATHFHFSLSCIGEGNGNPLQCSCLENLRDGRAWLAGVYGVAQSRTRLKQLSSSKTFWIKTSMVPWNLHGWQTCWVFFDINQSLRSTGISRALAWNRGWSRWQCENSVKQLPFNKKVN